MHKLGPHTIKLPCPKYQEYWGWKTLPNVPWNPTLQYEPTFKCIYSISIRSLNKSDIFFPPHIYKPVLESQGLLNVLCNILQCLLLRQLRTCHLTFTRWLHYLQHHTSVLGEKGGGWSGGKGHDPGECGCHCLPLLWSSIQWLSITLC